MKEIPLSQGKVALVDEADFACLSQWKWCAYHTENLLVVRWYVMRKDHNRTVRMHRLILGNPIGFDVDHVNGDGLDNRRCNLRIATRQENARNQCRLRAGKTSAYKGVTRSQGKWVARIRLGQTRPMHLGYFRTEIDAACAYDRAALQHFGDFAHPNFPQRNEERRS